MRTVIAMLFALFAVIFGVPLSTSDRFAQLEAQVKGLELDRAKSLVYNTVCLYGAFNLCPSGCTICY